MRLAMEIQIQERSVSQTDTDSPTSVAYVHVVGDIDGISAPEVQSKVLPLAAPGSKMILDLTQVPYMSSAGLRMLLSVYRQMSSQDGKVVLVGLSDEIKDTMSITGFLDFFQASDTLKGAYEILGVTP
jgi:anti-sigma B factor antagonist